MFKKIFSVILVLIICCSISITVFSQTDHSHAERNAPAALDAGSAIDDSIAPDHEAKITDWEVYIIPEEDPEFWEESHGAPDEVLSGSTSELLEYFLQTQFIRQRLYSEVYASSFSAIPTEDFDYSVHEAFRELISREDFLEVLEDHAKTIPDASKSDDDEDKRMIEKILAQPRVRSLVSDSANAAYEYPNLQSMYAALDADAAPAAVGDYVDTIDGIRYYSAGTIGTANNRRVEVCTPIRD